VACMRIGAVVLVGLVGSVLMCGCGAASAGPTGGLKTATPSSGTRTTTTSPSAKELTTRMVEALDSARTGAYVNRMTTDGGTFTLTQTESGSYDLRKGGWTSVRHAEANPPTAFGQTVTDLDMEMVVVGGTAYMRMTQWPSKWRGRWLRLDPSSLSAAAPSSLGAEPFPVLALRAFSGESVDLGADGSATISGRVTLESGLGLLGLQTGVVKAGIDPSTLEGSARVTVDVDAQGRPLSLTLDGHDVVVDKRVPEQMVTLLPSERAEVRFTDLGTPVTVMAPPQAKLIDPSEMTP